MLTADQIIDILTTVLPTLILLFGGQWLLNRWEVGKKRREERLALARTIREKQYQTVELVYSSFGRFMELYRLIHQSPSYPKDENELAEFLSRAAQIESDVDALIVRICCEFVVDEDIAFQDLLGHMRQSAQLWRESLRAGTQLPFKASHSVNYAKFKETFTGAAAYMVHHIHSNLEPPEMRVKEAREMVVKVFTREL